ncbi:MAG: PTS transporter subunit EIIA [Phycisphaerales bacterium]|nr:PTS transporter subunit EIIA [Phycisphaerales bacterium]
MNALSHHDITVLLFSLAILLATARLLGEAAQKLRQPAIIGEILAGILLGPTVLGAIAPDAHAAIFPHSGPVAIGMHSLTTVAIVLFLMVAGMEVDLSTVWKQGRAAIIVAVVCMVLPFAIGFVPGWFAPDALGAKPGSDPLVFGLFLATAMAITALPVIARILLDLNLFRTDVGTTIIAAAILNDLFGWIIFALVLALMGGAGTGHGVGQTAALTLTFAILMLTVGRALVNRVLPWVQAHTGWPGGVLAFALTLTLLCAAYTEFIGVHGIFGSFLFGVALGDSPHLRRRTRTTIDHFVSFIFAPLFFASIGLRVDFLQHLDIPLVLVILLLATVGKVGGGFLAARWAGFATNEARAIGFGMNARGAMEIILGLLALDAGIIGERLFVALVIMALITSLASAVFLQRAFPRARAVRFVDFVNPKSFVPDLGANGRLDALARLARLAAEAAGINPDAAVNAVCRREDIVSSAIGRGVAIPHARLPGLKQPSLAVGISAEGIDFDPPDGIPVSVVILILTPVDAAAVHLAVLADIARSFRTDRVSRAAAERARNLTEFRAVLNVEGSRPPEP